jgi:thioredoxin 1
MSRGPAAFQGHQCHTRQRAGRSARLGLPARPDLPDHAARRREPDDGPGDPDAAAAARSTPMPSLPVTDAEWTSEVLESDKPVLVDFWAEWCGPCRMVSPIVDEIASEHGDALKVLKLNVDENPATAREYGIMSIPTLMVFSGGQPAKRIVGAKGKAALLSDLAEFVG